MKIGIGRILDRLESVIGNLTDSGSLAADTSSLMAVSRKGAKESWEAEKHLHSGERWFGLAAAPSLEAHAVDRVGAGDNTAECAPLDVDAGNDDWGTWTQIIGSADTPTDSGNATHYDLHRIVISSSDDTAQRYMIQIALQEDAPADDPGSTDVYTEFEVISAGVGALATVAPFAFQCNRVAAGTKAWMRTRAPNQNTSNLLFYLGIHEYTDPDT